MRSTRAIRPQDILVLAKLLAGPRKSWRQIDLAQELGLSQFEVGLSLESCRRAGLLNPDKKKPLKKAALEFLVHGLKYAFPAETGSIVRGIPTAHSAPPLAGKIISRESGAEQYVWPYAKGKVRGVSVIPLYPSAPEAAQKDEKLYELLALLDAIRLGRTREQKLAIEILKARLDGDER